MNFVFFTNESEEVLSLIKDVFKIESDNKTVKLQDNQRILLLKDNNNKVIGLTMITLKYDPFKDQKTYYLDYVCIKEEYRHQQLGKKMFDKVMEIAIENKIDNIELTSNKSRVEARNMYMNCRMNIKDTEVFVKEV